MDTGLVFGHGDFVPVNMERADKNRTLRSLVASALFGSHAEGTGRYQNHFLQVGRKYRARSQR